jgi:hypothetical protein
MIPYESILQGLHILLLDINVWGICMDFTCIWTCSQKKLCNRKGYFLYVVGLYKICELISG